MAASSNPRARSPSSDPIDVKRDAWGAVEVAARTGYAAKGIVYAVIGGLAVQLALGQGGDASGTREALEAIAGMPLGRTLLGIVSLGLAAYTVWRLVQAVLDPEGDRSDDGSWKRWGLRGFHLASGLIYGTLAYYGARLALGTGGGGGGDSSGWVARLMGMSWGVWLVAGVGVGIVIRGVLQLVKAYTQSFRKRISTFELGQHKEKWAMSASRVGLTARGVIFGLIGSSIVYAAATRDPQQARGLEGALEFLVTTPWLLGAVGLGLVAYGFYQWVKARYRLIGV